MIAFSYLVEKIDFVIPWPQISVYKVSAQVARLTTLCIEISIKIPTMWYIATLVPLGVQRILFLPGSSKGLHGSFITWSVSMDPRDSVIRRLTCI